MRSHRVTRRPTASAAAAAAASTRGGFSDGYLRGVLDKSELPQVTRVKMRAGYVLEPNTLDAMQQAEPIAMSADTQREVAASQMDAPLHSVHDAVGGGVHFRITGAAGRRGRGGWGGGNNAKSLQDEWAEAREHVRRSRSPSAMVREVQAEVAEAHRLKWGAVRERRVARAGEKRDFYNDLRDKRSAILGRLHRLTREMEQVQQAKEVRDQRSPRHSRHRREMHRHFQTSHKAAFPQVHPKKLQRQLTRLEHSKQGTFASQFAAEMWRHRASMLRR